MPTSRLSAHPETDAARTRSSWFREVITPLLLPFLVGPAHPRPRPPRDVWCWAVAVHRDGRETFGWVVGHPYIDRRLRGAGPVTVAALDRLVRDHGHVLFPGARVGACAAFRMTSDRRGRVLHVEEAAADALVDRLRQVINLTDDRVERVDRTTDSGQSVGPRDDAPRRPR